MRVRPEIRCVQHRRLGTTKSGTPVFVDERFIGADLHLTLGFIEPHLMLGFSGGRKLIAGSLEEVRHKYAEQSVDANLEEVFFRATGEPEARP